jgi:hypothetical protein
MMSGQDQERLFTRLIRKSEQFYATYATLKTLQNRIALCRGRDLDAYYDMIERFANGARPIIHESVKMLIRDFINVKRQVGTAAEKSFYGSSAWGGDDGVLAFVRRLLYNRPVMFYLPEDIFLRRKSTDAARGGFEEIHNRVDRLAEHISYPEMEISALVSMSVPTLFINAGGRNNSGRRGDPGTFQPQGVYTGCVGARLEKANVMEWRHLVVTRDQNTEANGYGNSTNDLARQLKVWADFYGIVAFPTYATVAHLERNNPADFRLRYVNENGAYWTPTTAAALKIRLTASWLDWD